jgi:DNA repair exonuclease SbcCD nuclease subunit
MRVLNFSDLHGHGFKPYSTTLPNGLNSRLQDAANVLDEIYVACDDGNIDVVLFAGDLFHARSTLQVATFNTIYEGIAKIKTRVKDFGMLVGNHDQATKLGDIHACYAFSSIVQVMDRPGWFGFTEGGALQVYAIPHTENKPLIEQNLTLAESSIPSGYPSCCLAHVGVSGAVVGSNFVLLSKDNPTTVPFTRPGFDQVFLGHYHKPQLLAPNVRYLGATHQHNWGDSGQERGYSIWDTDTNEVEFFPIKSAPKFVWWDADEMTNKVKLAEAVSGNIVRIKYDMAPEADAWKWAKEKMAECGAIRVEQWVEPTVAGTLTPGDEQQYQPGADFEDMVESFVADSDYGSLDKARLVELGKSILKGVQ